ncbi:MAG: response regulator [Luteitalea sp.]|nr:response regulator [Luteitalea sp.]
MTSHQAQIGVALVEPQTLLREALTTLLNADPGIAVIAAAADASALLKILERRPCDLALLSIEPGGEDFDRELDGLNRLSHQRRSLVLTGDRDPAFHQHLITLGSMGVVSKGQTPEALQNAIRKVHGGERWVDRSRLSLVVKRPTHEREDGFDDASAKVHSLTAREREVVVLIADGLTNERIAERLFLSVFTVRNHLTAILGKLDLADRFQLAVYAFRRGLVLCPLTAERRRMSEVMRCGFARVQPAPANGRSKTGSSLPR